MRRWEHPKRFSLELYLGPTIPLGRLWPGDDDDGGSNDDGGGNDENDDGRDDDDVDEELAQHSWHVSNLSKQQWEGSSGHQHLKRFWCWKDDDQHNWACNKPTFLQLSLNKKAASMAIKDRKQRKFSCALCYFRQGITALIRTRKSTCVYSNSYHYFYPQEKVEKVFQYQNWFRLNREKKICIAYYKNSILGLGKVWILYIVSNFKRFIFELPKSQQTHGSIIWTKMNFNTQHKY